MGLSYSLLFFITFNGMTNGITISIFILVPVTLNILSWKILHRMKARNTFPWLEGYILLFIPVVCVSGGLEEWLGVPLPVADQFAIIVTSCLMELLIFIALGDNSRVSTGSKSEIDDCLDDHDSVDITSMAD